MQRTAAHRGSIPTNTFSIQLLYPVLREHHGRGDRKMIRTKGIRKCFLVMAEKLYPRNPNNMPPKEDLNDPTTVDIPKQVEESSWRFNPT